MSTRSQVCDWRWTLINRLSYEKCRVLINLSSLSLNRALEDGRVVSTGHFWTVRNIFFLSLSWFLFHPYILIHAVQKPIKCHMFWIWTLVAGVQLCSMWIMLSSQDAMGFTCLHLAAKLGHYDIVNHLVSKASKYINCQVKHTLTHSNCC